MKLRVAKMPKFVTWFYPKRIWAFSRSKKEVFLTFDDGPIPEVTPWVLETLRKFEAKATFFCIGENIQKHPEVFQQVLSEGHSIGNHTFHHLKGSQTSVEDYVKDVEKFELISPVATSLFRPPYGRLTGTQSERIQQKGYQVVMWDIVSYDWDAEVTPEKCLQNVLKHIQPGSIIVFHDSLKAATNLRFILPKVLEAIQEKKWKAKAMVLS